MAHVMERVNASGGRGDASPRTPQPAANGGDTAVARGGLDAPAAGDVIRYRLRSMTAGDPDRVQTVERRLDTGNLVLSDGEYLYLQDVVSLRVTLRKLLRDTAGGDDGEEAHTGKAAEAEETPLDEGRRTYVTRKPRTCATCGVEFVPSGNRQKFCPAHSQKLGGGTTPAAGETPRRELSPAQMAVLVRARRAQMPTPEVLAARREAIARVDEAARSKGELAEAIASLNRDADLIARCGLRTGRFTRDTLAKHRASLGLPPRETGKGEPSRLVVTPSGVSGSGESAEALTTSQSGLAGMRRMAERLLAHARRLERAAMHAETAERALSILDAYPVGEED